jgi:hypothetical protein
MLRWLATAAIVPLLLLAVALPQTSIGRRGTETRVRADVADMRVRIGTPLPDLRFETISGEPYRSVDLLGHRVLLIFERSVDW